MPPSTGLGFMLTNLALHINHYLWRLSETLTHQDHSAPARRGLLQPLIPLQSPTAHHSRAPGSLHHHSVRAMLSQGRQRHVACASHPLKSANDESGDANNMLRHFWHENHRIYGWHTLPLTETEVLFTHVIPKCDLPMARDTAS